MSSSSTTRLARKRLTWGVIYCSPFTSAIADSGETHRDFEASEGTQSGGFLIEEVVLANGGLLQRFEKGMWCFKMGEQHAHELHDYGFSAVIRDGGPGVEC
ncbi:hypothetical protein K469DRAFT_397473 [Zopfia rhizophila CBS 207.26]|uniref:Uncharacterized protein n=1 Tax=Zopfia rhizophila CBS 207.26 TaxID=1314779 RepID=A0A6A6DB66_9PEZI|nr:hypothetical protein K469DRAFT_397473 [Zopfia rhizophila CBS 207.26]